ncbi:hypothetical protein AYO44_00345 [Planctomycetaceae bacterium SCGC AG-212-F19]|nr:hypothetical protein AYO44_00345 [Planctomycetaceae bacterium SCGC AG-212-F19]
MKLTRMLLSLVALGLLAGVAYVNQATESTAGKMTGAAEKFLGSLSAEQKTQAAFAFDDKERLNWHFVPLEKDKKPARNGLRLELMNADQKAAALDLLKAGTSMDGFTKAVTIMSLESILLDLEKGSGPTRNPGWYFFAVFGTPSKTGAWGWRVEGHHLSLNFTLDKGQVVSATPAMFGANPAVVKGGAKDGLRTLPEAEVPVKELFGLLSDDEKKVVVQPKAFPEIAGKAAAPKVGDPVGLPGAKMNDKQKAALTQIVEGYANRLAPDVAAAYLAEVKQGGGVDKLYFALSGVPEAGKKYTYRVQGGTFVIEFLNEQEDSAKNPANHIHSAWRSIKNDFGLASK